MAETIGERIARLRRPKGWKRPELGRRMAQAIGREEPFSGEAVRRWEEDIDPPGREARKALAKVFARSEAYIEFGDVAQARGVEQPGADYAALSEEALEVARAVQQLRPEARAFVRDVVVYALDRGFTGPRPPATEVEIHRRRAASLATRRKRQPDKP